MAITTLTFSPQKITVPANTDEHEINCDGVMTGSYGSALIEWVSGTSIQINASGATIDTATGAINSAQNKLVVSIKKGTNIKYKGGAGSEEFQITVLAD